MNYPEPIIEKKDKKPEEAKHFPVGSRVSHPMFGKGEIISASPMGGDVLYEIEFDNGSFKRLMGTFAKLTLC